MGTQREKSPKRSTLVNPRKCKWLATGKRQIENQGKTGGGTPPGFPDFMVRARPEIWGEGECGPARKDLTKNQKNPTRPKKLI